MNKKLSCAIAVVATVALAGAIAGCSSSGTSDSGSEGTSSGEYAEGSLLAYHENLGEDLSGLLDTEVTWSSCENDGCHGSYEEIRDETEDMWEGIGQITDANPHSSHASNSYECTDCHTLTDSAQINQCNKCHDFDTPEGWDDADPTTTIDGVTATEPLYSDPDYASEYGSSDESEDAESEDADADTEADEADEDADAESDAGSEEE